MIKRLLVANRGEVAVRIMATASVLGVETVAVYPADDAACGHVGRADAAVELPGTGVAAYLDVDAIIAAAAGTGCDMLHPGYGFLSERPELAARCAAAGLRFAGPGPEALALFGDKAAARARARELGVPVLAGTGVNPSPGQVLALLREHGAVMVKAVAGGGGRGLRPVTREQDSPAPRRCAGAPRGGGGLRRRAGLRRAAAAPGPACRGPARRRRHGRRGRARRPRLQPAAAAAEADRDRAGGGGRRGPRPAVDGRGGAGRFGRIRRPGHRRVPGPGRRDRLPRGQPPAAGRAHGHRTGHRAGPGRARAARRGRRHHRRAGAGRGGAARGGRAGAGQRRDPAAGRHVAAGRRHAEPVPAAGRARRPRRRGATRATPSARTTTRCWPR